MIYISKKSFEQKLIIISWSRTLGKRLYKFTWAKCEYFRRIKEEIENKIIS